MQWLDEHIYEYEHQHPPLTRVMVALGPYLAGVRGNHQKEMNFEGNTLLYTGNEYDKRLALSRAGNLPFFWLACWMVFLWGRRIFGSAGAVIAVLIFTMIPTLLAHAGLSTTDMGLTATFAAALYALMRILEEPGPKTAAWFGLALGLMVLAKFSALVYFPAGIALALFVWIVDPEARLSDTARGFIKRIPGSPPPVCSPCWSSGPNTGSASAKPSGHPSRSPFLSSIPESSRFRTTTRVDIFPTSWASYGSPDGSRSSPC